jgi:hypothetical protein
MLEPVDVAPWLLLPPHDRRALPPDSPPTMIQEIGALIPTLIASMYGMNFKGLPEYDWSWGYPYGLPLIALSAILPLIWFKLRGWI